MIHNKTDSAVTAARDPKACSRAVLASGCLFVTCTIALSISLNAYFYISQDHKIAIIQEQLDELRLKCAITKYAKEQPDLKTHPSEDLYFYDNKDRSAVHENEADDNGVQTIRQSSHARVRRSPDSEGSGRSPRSKSKTLKKLIQKTVKRLLRKSQKQAEKSKEETKNDISSLEERVTELDRSVQLLRNATGSPIFGVHYVGKVENVRHANGDVINDKFLRSRDGTFPDWTPAQWMSGYPYANKFELESDGGVRVKEGGLYWIYAQMMFFNDEDGNAMFVKIKPAIGTGDVELGLVTCVFSDFKKDRDTPETCFGGALHRLQVGDVIVIFHYFESAKIYFEKDRTFFGLIRLSP